VRQAVSRAPGRRSVTSARAVPVPALGMRGISAAGSPARRCAPTDMKPSWLTSNASSWKPASPNQDRIAGGQVRRPAVPGPEDQGAGRAQAGQGRHRGPDAAGGDVAEDAAHHDDLGGDRARAGIGDPGAGLEHLDAGQPGGLRRLPRHRDVALVQLDQPGVHFVPARMPGQDPDHVPALPGAQADQPYVPSGGKPIARAV
jgi:hypothetical protein